MGLILDSSVLIAAERKGQNARQALTAISRKTDNTEIALSVITVMELAHGAARAENPAREAAREEFIRELVSAVPVHPITTLVALRAGHIDGENTARGNRVALSDLLIGVTALELGYAVATANLRDFQRIPDLDVISL